MSANQDDNTNEEILRRRIGDMTIYYTDRLLQNGMPSPDNGEAQFEHQQDSNDAEDGLAAFDLARLLYHIALEVDADKVAAMRNLYNLGVPENSKCKGGDAQHLLEVMKTNKYISRHSLIFLQLLLWETGQKELFEKVGRWGKKQKRDGHDVAYFLVPCLQPVNAYHLISIHVNKNFSVQHQEDYRRMLANVLKIDPDCLKPEGVLPSNSFWLTFLVPQPAFTQLLKSLLDDDNKSSLELPKVDKISFLQTTLPTDLDTMNEDSDEKQDEAWDMLTKAKEAQGHWLTFRVPGTAHSALLTDLLEEGSGTVGRMTEASVDRISFLQDSPLTLAQASKSEPDESAPPSQSANHETPKISPGSNGLIHDRCEARERRLPETPIPPTSQLPNGPASATSEPPVRLLPSAPASCKWSQNSIPLKSQGGACGKEFSEGGKNTLNMDIFHLKPR